MGRTSQLLPPASAEHHCYATARAYLSYRPTGDMIVDSLVQRTCVTSSALMYVRHCLTYTLSFRIRSLADCVRRSIANYAR